MEEFTDTFSDFLFKRIPLRKGGKTFQLKKERIFMFAATILWLGNTWVAHRLLMKTYKECNMWYKKDEKKRNANYSIKPNQQWNNTETILLQFFFSFYEFCIFLQSLYFHCLCQFKCHCYFEFIFFPFFSSLFISCFSFCLIISFELSTRMTHIHMPSWWHRVCIRNESFSFYVARKTKSQK